jgi:glucose/arabinose dehydrogenase
MLIYISNQSIPVKWEIKWSKSGMNNISYIVMCVIAAVLILLPSYIARATQPSESNNTGINNNNKIDRHIEVKKNQTAEVNFHNKTEMITKSLYSDPNFAPFDNRSELVSFGLPFFWDDLYKSCDTSFKCRASNSTGWKDNTSYQIATTHNTNNTWSSIYGQPIDTTPKVQYQLVNHMKLNTWATESHIAIEGYNETSNGWYQIHQCPSGINGPLEWREFSCIVTVPKNTTKIRPVLNAGWSSNSQKEAVTWYDSIYMVKVSQPFFTDPNLKAEVIVKGLKLPTSMAFLGTDDILVSEQNGTLQRIVNGVKLPQPLIDLNVVSKTDNQGFLGIAVLKNTSQASLDKQLKSVYLYYTAYGKQDESNIKANKSLHNFLYKYDYLNNRIFNPKVVLDLPGGDWHNGGKMLIDHNNLIYLIVGEANAKNLAHLRNEALNYQGNHSDDPDGRGGVLRIDQNGREIGTHGILGDKAPLNKYYAYGIRNSFGMDFDPVTGKLWDTENGPTFGDEINLVEPGFNSGWNKVQGLWTVTGDRNKENPGLVSEKPNNLVSFDGNGKYRLPEFTWNHSVGLTALKFLSTDKLGKQYENDMLTTDVVTKRIYDFKLNHNRTGLVLNGSLTDKVADSDDELDDVVFAGGFGLISDLQIGPDGYLYVVVFYKGEIYRVVPKHAYENILPDLDQVSKNSIATN